MARQQATAIENQFVKGLITENTALNFPTNACTSVSNCVIDSTGTISRRLGFDYESGYSLGAYTPETGEAFTEFLWNSVAGNGTLAFVVQQQGSTIRFYDISSSLTVSANLASFTIDLNSYLPVNSSQDPAIYECSYAQGNGDLLIANPVIDPVYVSYDLVSNNITVTSIDIKYRDFEGVDDGLTLTQRVTSDVATLKTSNPEHYYNLLNQGWYTADALSKWDAARTDLPSNADMVSYFRSSETNAFDNLKVNAKDPGTSPATRGHFILSAPAADRQTAASDAGFTGFTLTGESSYISGGTNIGDMTDGSGLAGAFDGDTTQDSSSGSAKIGSSSTSYIGKTISSNPKRALSCTVYGSNDLGFVNTGASSITITFYGKNGAAPATSSDGTSLGTVSFTNTSDESAGRSITSSDTTTYWDHLWVQVDNTSTTSEYYVAELRMFTVVSGIDQRPKCVAFYSSRAFWAGINKTGFSNIIYFSKVIERQDEYGNCYQVNDPTSEQLAELLSSDGGAIKIMDMGDVKRLFVARNSLLVFASNGVWLISGAAGTSFKATEYQVKRITSVGMNSPMSIVDLNGMPLWWGEDGIYTVQYDANYDSFQLVSMTANTIDTFINDIPALNRRYVKGATDVLNKTVTWLYNSDGTLASTDYYKYDSVLVFDSIAKCFYPWTIESSAPVVRGIVYALEGNRSEEGAIKYTTTVGATLGFSETNSTRYLDWYTYNTTGVDYTSDFVTGYRLDGQTQRFFQSNYIFVFLNTETNSSCYVQGVWDWTNSSASGKWSNTQQVYNSSLTNRGINHRRLKIRGKGKALQLHFESETGKPFNIIGWSIWESSNASV